MGLLEIVGTSDNAIKEYDPTRKNGNLLKEYGMAPLKRGNSLSVAVNLFPLVNAE